MQFDVVRCRQAADGLADDVQCEVFELLEANAAFAHVELLSTFGPGGTEPFFAIAVVDHQVDGHVVFCAARPANGSGRRGSQ